MLTGMEVATFTGLQILWFLLIAVLWIGFFFLEGFDFGVAMLYPLLGRDPQERRVMVNTIGPVWDGNEVWLLTAGGAMFAAFPGWYATLFSALYIPFFLVLFGLIIRGVAFEYRALRPDDRWRDAFDACASIGSFVVTLVFGVGFANFVKGLPVDGDHLFTGTLLGLFSPFALLGGVMLVVLFLAHGSQFLSLKTYGTVHEKARSFSLKATPAAIVLVGLFVAFQNIFYPATDNPYLGGVGSIGSWVGILSVLALIAAFMASRAGRDGWAFISTGLAVITLFAGIFVKMYGNLGFISADAANPLNMAAAASSVKTLGLMRIFAFIMVPIVLAYQSWTYWVFRRRLSTKQMPKSPLQSDAVVATV